MLTLRNGRVYPLRSCNLFALRCAGVVAFGGESSIATVVKSTLGLSNCFKRYNDVLCIRLYSHTQYLLTWKFDVWIQRLDKTVQSWNDSFPKAETREQNCPRWCRSTHVCGEWTDYIWRMKLRWFCNRDNTFLKCNSRYKTTLYKPKSCSQSIISEA